MTGCRSSSTVRWPASMLGNVEQVSNECDPFGRAERRITSTRFLRPEALVHGTVEQKRRAHQDGVERISGRGTRPRANPSRASASRAEPSDRAWRCRPRWRRGTADFLSEGEVARRVSATRLNRHEREYAERSPVRNERYGHQGLSTESAPGAPRWPCRVSRPDAFELELTCRCGAPALVATPRRQRARSAELGRRRALRRSRARPPRARPAPSSTTSSMKHTSARESTAARTTAAIASLVLGGREESFASPPKETPRLHRPDSGCGPLPHDDGDSSIER